MGDSAFYAVVLAAGAATRFGGGKLLAAYKSGVLVEAAVRAALAAPVKRVFVVVQPGQETASWANGERLVAIPCTDWAEGMAASLRAGIAALPEDAEGVFVFLGDMPRIPLSVLKPLAQAVLDGAAAALPVFEDQDGHPVVFSCALFSELLALKGDRGARAILTALGQRVARIPAPDDGVLLDIDRPDDLLRLQTPSAPPIPH